MPDGWEVDVILRVLSMYVVGYTLPTYHPAGIKRSDPLRPRRGFPLPTAWRSSWPLLCLTALSVLYEASWAEVSDDPRSAKSLTKYASLAGSGMILLPHSTQDLVPLLP